jgi:hypothetical protein
MTSVQVSKVLGSSTPAQQRTRSRRFTAEREQGTHSAEVVVAGALAVELARAEVDVLHARPPISEKHSHQQQPQEAQQAFFDSSAGLAQQAAAYRGAVAVHPRLGLEAVGAGIAHVESDGLEEGEHSARAACTGVESALAGATRSPLCIDQGRLRAHAWRLRSVWCSRCKPAQVPSGPP